MPLELAKTPHGSFHYWPQDEIGAKIASGEFWDEHFKPFMETLQPGDLLVDVGANIGFFTVYAALIRGACVAAFEPSPELFRVLAMNVEENGIVEQVDLHQVALYEHETVLALDPEWHPEGQLANDRIDYEHLTNSGGLSLIPPSKAPEGSRQFYARTVDSYNFENVRLLKIDAQGADLRILCGARETLARSRPLVCCELESYAAARYHGDDMDSFQAFFRDLAYDLRVVFEGMDGYFDFVAVPR